MSELRATVVGAGLAGSEAAWQLLRRGISVTLYDMKPHKKSPAHNEDYFAELVCSNSLRSDRLQNAAGLIKEEMRKLDSLIMMAADQARVPAGGALAVDRDSFSNFVTEKLLSHSKLTYIPKEIDNIPLSNAIVATGPLTSDALSEAIAALPQVDTLHFYDAAAPIVTKESVDMSLAFMASRYGRGDDDYINCPMNKDEYEAFYKELLEAQTAPIHGFEESKVFEGCMPVESLARRGEMTLAFGPLKPVGLIDPRTGTQPYAVLQLRRDDASNSLYNLVGFQTRLKFPEQKRVFGMIPGLGEAEYARYGVMHRNTFLNSPAILDSQYMMKETDGVYFAGQMTGVEGYIESAASGLCAGIHLARRMLSKPEIIFSPITALGALSRYVSTYNRHYQPMHISFGLIEPLKEKVRNKEQRYLKVADLALHTIDELKESFLIE